MSELEVRELTKRIDGKLIVDNISFRIADDEFFVILGPSGSGKSSLLRLLCGFDEPDHGRIFLDGEDITRQAPQFRNIAVVFQDYGLFPTMNVYDNIVYGLQARKISKQEVEMRMSTAIDMLGLQDIIKRSLTNLSGGELQRVALARVIVKNADIYLFDEPLSHLDYKTRYRTRQEIMMVHRIKRKPSIYITHDQNEAFAMANRIAVMSSGKIQQIGTADELLLTPQNLFVARFVGDPQMNLLEGYIQHINTRYRLRCDGMYFTLPARWTRYLARMGPQSKIVLGIRPGTVVPEWEFNTLGDVPHVFLRAQITHIEPIIGKFLVRLRIGHNTEITGEFNDPGTINMYIGQILNVGLNIENTYLFNPFTEQLLVGFNSQ